MLILNIFLVIADPQCTLLGNEDADKPTPSLVKCYRHNSLACCVSAHDQVIGDAYSSFFSTQCQREYDDMEDYFCYGCNPEQGEFIDTENKVIKICKDYAERVWDDDLDKHSSEYDNCGVFTYWRDNPTTVLPSLEWENAYEFFKEVKPPLFEDYEIVIVTEGDDCFNDAGKLGLMAFLMIFIAI